MNRVTETPWRWVLAALAAVTMFAAACGGDDGGAEGAEPGGDESGDPAGDDSAEAGALAEAIRIDAAVDARVADAADFVGVTDPVPVAVGDDVRTDTTGFAEIAYFDGSVTRLDVETDFEVVALVDSPGASVIRTRMGVGRTWHRVQALSGNDTYEVETSVATAVVRGTAFVISCTETACTFTVLEGTVEIVPPEGTPVTLEAGVELTVVAGSAPGDAVAVAGDPFADEWLGRNNDLDEGTGNADLAEEFAAPALSPDGEHLSWDLEHVLVDFQWGGDQAVDPPIGEVICSAADHTDCGPRNLDIYCVLDHCATGADIRFVGRGGWQPLAVAADGTLTFEDVIENSQCGWTETESGTFEIDPATLALTGEIRLDRTPLATDTCTGSTQVLTVTGTFVSSSTCDDGEHCNQFFAGEPGVWSFDRPSAWADLAAWGT